MRKLKKRTSLIALATIVAAVFAAPAVASGAEWTEEGHPLEETASIYLFGTLSTTSFLGGYGCEFAMAVTLEPGDEGQVWAMSFNTQACDGQGTMEGCEVVEASYEGGLPLHINEENQIEIEDVQWEWTFDDECGVHESTYIGDFTATPDDTKAMSSVGLEGQFIWQTFGLNLNSYWAGDLNVYTPGMYGIQ